MNTTYDTGSLRIQRLARPLWVGKDILLHDHNVYIHFWKDGVEMKKNLTKGKKLTNDVIFNAVQEAMAFIDRCNNPELNIDDIGAFASGPIPCNNGQHGVFAFSLSGETRDCANRKNNNADVIKAYKSILTFGKTEPKKQKTVFQKIAPDKKVDDKIVLVCEATIDEDMRHHHYTFLADEELFVGDRRTAHLKSGEYKPVTVVKKTTATPASKLDHPLDWYVTLCTFLLKEHEKKEVKIMEEEIEYEEDINELHAMHEAFAPVCDYAPVNRDGYIYEEHDNYKPEDLDDLPD